MSLVIVIEYSFRQFFLTYYFIIVKNKIFLNWFYRLLEVTAYT